MKALNTFLIFVVVSTQSFSQADYNNFLKYYGDVYKRQIFIFMMLKFGQEQMRDYGIKNLKQPL